MQTFIPYSNLQKIIRAIKYLRMGRTYGWQKHPCVPMWYNNLVWLQYYYNLCIDEWEKRGYQNNMDKSYQGRFYKDFERPNWLGNKALHDSHKSNLLRKDKQFYSKYGWNVPDSLEYIWPK